MKPWLARVIFVLLLLCIAPHVRSELSPSDDSVGGVWTSTTAVTSQYLFRGARLGGTCLQPAVEWNRGATGLGLWTNVPLDNKVPGQSDPEMDFYGFYVWDPYHLVAIVPGFTLFGFPKADRSDGFHRAIIEPNLAANFTAGAFRITPKVFYDATRRGPTAELATAFAVPLAAIGSELDFSATLGTFLLRRASVGSFPTVKSWGNYLQFAVVAPYQISRVTRITLGFTYSSGRNAYLKSGDSPKVRNPAAINRGSVAISYIRAF